MVVVGSDTVYLLITLLGGCKLILELLLRYYVGTYLNIYCVMCIVKAVFRTLSPRGNGIPLLGVGGPALNKYD